MATVEISGVMLGIRTRTFGQGEAAKESHQLVLLQGMDSVNISLSAEKKPDAEKLTKNQIARIEAEVQAYRDKPGYYFRYERFLPIK